MRLRHVVLCLCILLPANVCGDEGPTLKVFYRSDCPPCVREINIVDAIAREHDDLSVQIITLDHKYISFNFPPNVRVIAGNSKEIKSLKRLGNRNFTLPFSVFMDEDGGVCGTHYGILGTERVDRWIDEC